MAALCNIDHDEPCCEKGGEVMKIRKIVKKTATTCKCKGSC